MANKLSADTKKRRIKNIMIDGCFCVPSNQPIKEHDKNEWQQIKCILYTFIDW